MTGILLVEDDDRLRHSLSLTLQEQDFSVKAVASSAEARGVFDGDGLPPEVLLVDVRLGDGPSGVDLVRDLSQASRLPLTIVISGAATISETVEALRLGVFDFIEKPFGKERLLRSVHNALDQGRLRNRVTELECQLGAEREMIGVSPPMRELRELIARIARSEARVLILGESGTGKELVAEQIHRQSARRDRHFVKLNCAALPSSLVEAELFGHARGAFTDARAARRGLFEEADGGTLFLDEIGDMAPEVQARLLRVLEDGSLRRLGENQDRKVDTRVVAATHSDLERAVDTGRFRRDLFFRLSHLPLLVPPLRSRPEDIRPLVQHFVRAFSLRHRLRQRQVAEELYAPLQEYGWPGNVRELRNLCERLVVLGSDPLTPEQLPADILRRAAAEETGWLDPLRLTSARSVVPFRRFRAECEKEYLESVLRRLGWNFTLACRELGLDRSYLHAKAAALGIVRPDATEK